MASKVEDNSNPLPREAADLNDSIKEKGSQDDNSPPRSEWNEAPRRSTRGGSLAALSQRHQSGYAGGGRKVLTQHEGYNATGYAWPAWRKWMLLSSIFAVQVSMNFNSVFAVGACLLSMTDLPLQHPSFLALYR